MHNRMRAHATGASRTCRFLLSESAIDAERIKSSQPSHFVSYLTEKNRSEHSHGTTIPSRPSFRGNTDCFDNPARFVPANNSAIEFSIDADGKVHGFTLKEENGERWAEKL